MASLTVLIPEEGESLSSLSRRLTETSGPVLLVLTGNEEKFDESTAITAAFFSDCRKIRDRLTIATKHPKIVAEARRKELKVLERTTELKKLLAGHEKQEQVLRIFSPQIWRQQLKSSLQRMGLLSVPRIRIFTLVGFSVLLFLFVVLRLLPSAEVIIRPRQEAVSQTMNVFLVQSGALALLENNVRNMPLVPISVSVHQSLTFDHISKEFIGTSSEVDLTVYNKSTEQYSLKSGTRFTNQAGMVFRSKEPIILAAGKQITIHAKADDTDMYDQIIGERGNVPAGIKWEIPGLSPEERKKVYAENKKAAKGGTTAHRTVLKQDDLELAKRTLEGELLVAAKSLIGERLAERNIGASSRLKVLQYDELTKSEYKDIVLPQQLLGTQVSSVPVEGSITYTVYAYDVQAILEMLKTQLVAHVREGRELLTDQLTLEDMGVVVIDYADDFSWIKLTVDLRGTERFVLDPLSPAGAMFAKRLREQVQGTSKDDALRIVKNMPEVEDVTISLWPPWSGVLPPIPSHISVTPE